MLSESVAQKPTMPVSAGKKKFQKSPEVAKREGCASIGPRPSAASTAHHSKASAASGRKIAFTTSSFLITATP